MLKLLLTVQLIIQRSANTFILHAAGRKVDYSSSVAILISELIKELICWILAVYEADKEAAIYITTNNEYMSVPLSDFDADQTGPDSIIDSKSDQISFRHFPQNQEEQSSLYQRIVQAISVVNEKTCSKEALMLMLPAGLFVIQNNLIMFAAPKIEPNVFQAAWQVRLLPTAYLSGLLLRKTISAKQWSCLLGVLLGVITIQTANTWRIDSGLAALDIHRLSFSRDVLIGTITLFFAAIISAFASVILEKIYSSKGRSLWIASFQLSFFSILPALFLVAIECFNAAHWWSPFESIFRSMWPWAVILTQAFVGILVGLMTKYAGSVGNGLAGIGSIALTSFIALLFPEDEVRTFLGKTMICFGIILTILFTHLYSVLGIKMDPKTENEDQVEMDLANVSLESVSIRSSTERY